MTETGIRYAITPDGFHIAYEVFGEGDLHHVFMGEFGGSLEVRFQHPALIPQKRFLGSLSRVICMDPRGLGSSDPVPPERLANLGDWIVDVVAVLDALGIEKVVVTGEGTFGALAVRLAASRPERVLRLALANAQARGTRADDYPIGFSDKEIDEIATFIGQNWGTGMVTAQFAPALGSDPSLRESCAFRERLSATPGTAEAWVRSVSRFDVRGLLPQIEIPTFVYFTGDLLHAPVEHSRYLAQHIPDAILIEAPGQSQSFYIPDEPDQLTSWAEFIVGGAARVTIDRRLATVLFTDVIGSTERAVASGDHRWSEVLEDLDSFVLTEVQRHGGRLIKQTGDGHLVTFDSPASAVRAASRIANQVHVFGVEMRSGLHAGEVEVRPNGDIGGIAVHTAARIMDKAGPRQVFASRTLADLAAGAGLRFESRGAHELKGIPGTVELYEVVVEGGPEVRDSRLSEAGALGLEKPPDRRIHL